MKLWMDIMRDVEHILDDHEQLFDTWVSGGVVGAPSSRAYEPHPPALCRSPISARTISTRTLPAVSSALITFWASVPT